VALTIDGLAIALSGRTILHGITARLAPGRITAIVGPNGAGKSTLLRAAAGLIPVNAGAVRLDGEDMAHIHPRDRGTAIGYLPQDPTVHWNLTARDLIALGRLPHRATTMENDTAIAAAIAATRTSPLADRPIQELSGGERARVLLARVLAGQPRWLLADEPLASLDPRHQFEALAMLRATADRGIGIMLVIHDLTQAARIADEVILLRDGTILASGPTTAVLTPYLLAAAFDVPFALFNDDTGLPVIVPSQRVGTI
jgi:iron complex transport system ATP-binding protein